MIFFATLYLLIANKIKLTQSTFGGKHVWMADLKSSKTCHLGPAKWGKHTFFLHCQIIGPSDPIVPDFMVDTFLTDLIFLNLDRIFFSF